MTIDYDWVISIQYPHTNAHEHVERIVDHNVFDNNNSESTRETHSQEPSKCDINCGRLREPKKTQIEIVCFSPNCHQCANL